MTTKDEALKLALDALHARISVSSRATEAEYKAAMACREALAQKDEQEPIGEAHAYDSATRYTHCIWDAYVVPVGTKLYTALPGCQPLTDEKLRAMWANYAPIVGGVLEFARAIEKAHGIGVEHDAQP